MFSVAQQYIGTPYVYGGASPAGFDCSGYVMFVYAQFGISLPHSVSGQAAMGKRISIADAQPGDIVIMSGHDGFYAGNGNIMDAPDTGRIHLHPPDLDQRLLHRPTRHLSSPLQPDPPVSGR